MSDGAAPNGSEFQPREGERRTEGLRHPGGIDRRASTADRRHAHNRQYATFYLENHFLGVEVLKVQEVLSAQEITWVPLSAKVVSGLINLRGQIVTAIDLRTQLGFPPKENGEDSMNIVVQLGDGPISLLVDKIGDVLEVRPDLFEPPPYTLDERLKEVIDGVYKLEDILLLALNIDAVTQVMEETA